MSKENPLVTKTVSINGSSETRKTRIKDWKNELALLSDADINKVSWTGQFRVSRSDDYEIYKSDNDKIPIKEIKIIFRKKQVAGLIILTKNSNFLYTSIDSLAYYPDSLYQFKKSQNIKLLSEKRYYITTSFK